MQYLISALAILDKESRRISATSAYHVEAANHDEALGLAYRMSRRRFPPFKGWVIGDVTASIAGGISINVDTVPPYPDL